MIDCDSFIRGVCGHEKQGARYGYAKELGYRPLLATRSDTRETLHIRLRRGNANTQRGITRFVDELIARVRRCGATGKIYLRSNVSQLRIYMPPTTSSASSVWRVRAIYVRAITNAAAPAPAET